MRALRHHRDHYRYHISLLGCMPQSTPLRWVMATQTHKPGDDLKGYCWIMTFLYRLIQFQFIKYNMLQPTKETMLKEILYSKTDFTHSLLWCARSPLGRLMTGISCDTSRSLSDRYQFVRKPAWFIEICNILNWSAHYTFLYTLRNLFVLYYPIFNKAMKCCFAFIVPGIAMDGREY